MAVAAPSERPTEDTAAPARGQQTSRRRRWGLSFAWRRSLGSAWETARHWITEVPLTRLGWQSLAASLVLWAAGWLTGWWELAIMAALGLVLLLLSVPFTLGRTSAAAQLRLSSLRVVVGERVAAELEVRNTGQRRQFPFELQLPVGQSSAAFGIPSLAAGEAHEELLIIPAERRAIVPIGPASAVRSDPLGLLQRRAPAGEKQDLYIHPRTVRVGHLGLGSRRDLEGAESDVLSDSDLAFHALREYEPGDDRRHIHWKSSARTNQLMVRQYVDTRRSHVTVVLSTDQHDYGSDDEFETAVSVAGSLGLQALLDDQQLAVVAGRRTLPSSSGQRLLDSLSGVDLTGRDGSLRGNGSALSGVLASNLVVLLAGSGIEPAAMRTAARAIRAAVPLCIRVNPDQQSGITLVGGVPTLSLCELGDLRRLLRAVA